MCTESWQRNTEGLKMGRVIFEIGLRFITMLIPTLIFLWHLSVFYLSLFRMAFELTFTLSAAASLSMAQQLVGGFWAGPSIPGSRKREDAGTLISHSGWDPGSIYCLKSLVPWWAAASVLRPLMAGQFGIDDAPYQTHVCLTTLDRSCNVYVPLIFFFSPHNMSWKAFCTHSFRLALFSDNWITFHCINQLQFMDPLPSQRHLGCFQFITNTKCISLPRSCKYFCGKDS